LNAPEALLPRAAEAGAPVFREAWHAEVLGVANALTAGGLFTAAEWAEALGAALRQAAQSGSPDGEATYYAAALAALEGLVAAKAPATGAGLGERVEAWRRAYRNTPHGKPVELAAADPDHHDHDDGDDHHHDHHG
jgi:nitrile hydratase accessory protein